MKKLQFVPQQVWTSCSCSVLIRKRCRTIKVEYLHWRHIQTYIKRDPRTILMILKPLVYSCLRSSSIISFQRNYFLIKITEIPNKIKSARQYKNINFQFSPIYFYSSPIQKNAHSMSSRYRFFLWERSYFLRNLI